MKKTTIFLLFFFFSFVPVQSHAQDNIVDYCGPAAKNLAVAYLGCFAYLLSHEFGHAFVSKIFTGSPIDIHLGAKFETFAPLLKTSNITLHTLNPLKGFAKFASRPEEHWKKFFIHIAGGVFGAAQSYLVLSGIAAHHKYQACQNLKESILYGLKNALSPFKNLSLNKNMSTPERNCHIALITLCLLVNLRKLVYSFLPSDDSIHNLLPRLSFRADGSRAWENLGASKSTRITVAFLSYLLEWGLRFWIVKKAIAATSHTSQPTHPRQ